MFIYVGRRTTNNSSNNHKTTTATFCLNFTTNLSSARGLGRIGPEDWTGALILLFRFFGLTVDDGVQNIVGH